MLLCLCLQCTAVSSDWDLDLKVRLVASLVRDAQHYRQIGHLMCGHVMLHVALLVCNTASLSKWECDIDKQGLFI